MTTQNALAAPDSAGAGAPISPAYGASPPLVLAQASLSSRSNIRPLPAGSGIAPGARIQSLKPRTTGPARGIASPTRKVAPGIGNSRFSIDRRRIDNRGLNAGTTDGLKQQGQERLGKQRLRTKTPDKEIVRTRQAAPSRLSKTKEQGSQPAGGAVKAAVPKTAGKGGLQTPAAGSAGSRRIPHHTPERTNFADGDPGATGASPGVYAVWLTTGLADGPQPGSSAGWTHTHGWPIKWKGPDDVGTVEPFDAAMSFGFVEFSVGAKAGRPGPTRYTNLTLKKGYLDGTQDIPFVVGRLFNHPGSVPPQDGPVDNPLLLPTEDEITSAGRGATAAGTVKPFNATKGFGFIEPDDGSAGGAVAQTAGTATGHVLGMPHDHQPPAASVDGQRLEFLRLLTVPVQPARPPFGTGLRQLEFAASSPAQGGGEVARMNASTFNPKESTFKKTNGDDATGDASVGPTPSGAAATGTIRGYDRTHRVTVGPTDAPTVGAGMTAGAGTASADSPDRPVLTGRVYSAESNAGQAAGGSSWLPEVGDEVLTGFEAGAAPGSDPSGYVGVRLQQGSVVTDQDFNDAQPGSAASALPTGKRQHKPFTVTGPTDGGTSAAAGRYDYPGDYGQRFDGVEPSQSPAGDVATEQITLTHERIERSSAGRDTVYQHNLSDLAFARSLAQGGVAEPATKDGGRKTPFFTNYRPQFYFRATDAPTGGELGDVTRPYVIGSLANGANAGSSGKASLYFPEQMLQEISESAGTADSYPGRYVQRFDAVSPDLPRVVVRGWDPVKKATVESQRFSGQYYVSGVTHQSADAAGSALGGSRASGRAPSGRQLLAHEAVHAAQQAGSPPAGPVPVPYPTVAEVAVTADAAGKVGKPLLVIAEDVEGESRATYGPWAYFRWSR